MTGASTTSARTAANAGARTGTTRGPGRPRSELCDRAIISAALDALVADGFESMTIEGVAARAGVGKATIYRRWPRKLDLVLDAVRTKAVASVPMPVSTDIHAALEQLLEDLRRTMIGPDGPVLRAFIAETYHHPELAEGFQRMFVEPRRGVLRRMVEDAMSRGQLPPSTDAELVADVGPATLWHRLTVNGAPLTADLPQRIVRQFLPRPEPARPDPGVLG
jgi:AcrR family transcriptional regulator